MLFNNSDLLSALYRQHQMTNKLAIMGDVRTFFVNLLRN